MIMNLSSSSRDISKNSGSGLTPTDYATESPIDLLIASPGIFSVLSQTLCGPIGWPFGSQKGSTRPPLFLILLLSSFLSGLWSIERLVDIQIPSIPLTLPATVSTCTSDSTYIHLDSQRAYPASLVLFKLPNTALESPTLAHINFFPYKKTLTFVVPL